MANARDLEPALQRGPKGAKKRLVDREELGLAEGVRGDQVVPVHECELHKAVAPGSTSVSSPLPS